MDPRWAMVTTVTPVDTVQEDTAAICLELMDITPAVRPHLMYTRRATPMTMSTPAAMDPGGITIDPRLSLHSPRCLTTSSPVSHPGEASPLMDTPETQDQ